MESNFKISFCIIPSSFSTHYCAQTNDQLLFTGFPGNRWPWWCKAFFFLWVLFKFVFLSLNIYNFCFHFIIREVIFRAEVLIFFLYTFLFIIQLCNHYFVENNSFWMSWKRRNLSLKFNFSWLFTRNSSLVQDYEKLLWRYCISNWSVEFKIIFVMHKVYLYKILHA